MTEPITIGVDHGYAAMKTAHCSYPSGLAEYEHEPYFAQFDVTDAEGAIYNRELTDVMDLMKEILKETNPGTRRK